MAESEVAKIPRPKQMRGFLHSQIKRNLTLAIISTIASGIAWRVFFANPRKQKYADFYLNYDAEAEFERMRKKGLFQSCSADDDVE